MKKKVLYPVLFLIILLICAFIYTNRSKVMFVITPFLIAIVIVYISNPLVKILEKRNIPRTLTIIIVYLFFITMLTGGCVFFFPVLRNNAEELAATLPNIISEYEKLFWELMSMVRYSNWSEQIKSAIFNEIEEGTIIVQNKISSLLGRIVEGLAGTLSFAFHFLLSLVIAFYFMKDSESLKRFSISIFPRKWRREITDIVVDIDKVLSSFIQGQLIISLIVAVIETTGLYLAGVDYAFILGLIGGITNIIPYFGPYIGVVPAVVIAFMQSPLKALWTVIIFASTQQIENSLITPRIIQQRLGLHPLATILVVLAGGQFFGIAGLLLAVPFTAVVRVIGARLINWIAGS